MSQNHFDWLSVIWTEQYIHSGASVYISGMSHHELQICKHDWKADHLFLQRLSGRSISPSLQMFGQSISGNVDMDGNGYPGLATLYTHHSFGLREHLIKPKWTLNHPVKTTIYMRHSTQQKRKYPWYEPTWITLLDSESDILKCLKITVISWCVT